MDTEASALPRALHDAFAAQDATAFERALSTLTPDQLPTAYFAFAFEAASAGPPLLPVLHLLLPHRPHTNDELLAAAAESGSPAVADALLDAGVDLHIPPSFGNGLLIMCVEEDRVALVEHLLSPSVRVRAGTAVDEELSDDHYSSLAAAQSPAMLRVLVAAGPTVPGSMALHLAAREGRTDAMRCLLDEFGADANEDLAVAGAAAERDGRPEWEWLQLHKELWGTPVHWAADQRRAEALRLLLERGADAGARDAGGRDVRERSRWCWFAPTNGVQWEVWKEGEEVLREFGH